MFVSLGSIIGSGWLFGALYASQIAGPAALISWGLGAVFMLTLALVHAELGGAYPVSGGDRALPALLAREHRRLHGRLALVARRRHGRADRGRGRAAVLHALPRRG